LDGDKVTYIIWHYKQSGEIKQKEREGERESATIEKINNERRWMSNDRRIFNTNKHKRGYIHVVY
jgi:hypothetical protein